MNVRALCLPSLLIVLPMALSGCSGPRLPQHDAPDAAAKFVAIARGEVTVQGGLLSVVSPVDGTVDRVDVHEGEHVHAGQVLASLEETAAQSTLDQAKARLQGATARETLLALQQKTAQQMAHREIQAAKAGAGAGQAADTAAARVAELGARRQAALADIAVARAQLRSARHLLELHSIRTPVDASVERLETRPGASVRAHSGELVLLVPDQSPIVRAELNVTYAGKIHAGMAASIIPEDGADNQAWPAHVVRVGRVLRTSQLAEDPAARATERSVQCVLAFDTPSHLRIGRRVLVRFPAANKAGHDSG